MISKLLGHLRTKLNVKFWNVMHSLLGVYCSREMRMRELNAQYDRRMRSSQIPLDFIMTRAS